MSTKTTSKRSYSVAELERLRDLAAHGKASPEQCDLLERMTSYYRGKYNRGDLGARTAARLGLAEEAYVHRRALEG